MVWIGPFVALTSVTLKKETLEYLTMAQFESALPLSALPSKETRRSVHAPPPFICKPRELRSGIFYRVEEKEARSEIFFWPPLFALSREAAKVCFSSPLPK